MVHLYSKLRMFLTLSLMLISFIGFSQKMTVKGTITDSNDGSPLFGATVLEKGTSNGTTADFDGNYTIEVEEGAFLVFSFVGYEKQEIEVTSGTLNVQLATTMTGLDEVLVIGYGVQKKSDKTGAVYSVSEDDIQTIAIQDPIEGIQGKISGVTIRKAGSDPNAGFDVKIRGASGLSASTSPLYVVDGVIGVDPTTVAPEDIASFNILKDASSTAIYGSRGANGVIIITTKQGEEGKTKVEFNTYLSVDQIARKSLLDLMSGDQFRAYSEQINYADGDGVRDLGYNTDWQDEIYRIGYSNSQSFAFSSSTESSNFRASVSNTINEGIVKNSSKERLIMRFNGMTKAFDDRLTLTMNLSNAIEHNNYINYGSSGADGVLYQAFIRNPTIPVYNEDGSFFQDDTPPVNNYSNPVAILNDIQNERAAKRMLANLKADFKLFEGMTLTVRGSMTRDDHESFYFEPKSNGPLNGDGNASRSYSNNENKLFEAFANYTRDIGKNTITLLGGYSYQQFNWDGFNAFGKNPASDYTQSHNLGSLALVIPGNIGSYKGESKLISGYGRFIYDFDNRFFLTGTLRRDGSSRFGANHQWGLFPSGSIAWNIMNEKFMDKVDFMSQAKLRIGYGQTGNQEINAYNNIVRFGITGVTEDPDTGEYTISYGATGNPNEDLKWEVNTETNIGVDFGFMDDRIYGSVDVYNKKTTDLLYVYTANVPPNLVNYILANGGAIDINGIEGSITGFIVDNSNFKWSSTFVASHDKQIVQSLDNEKYDEVGDVLEGYLQEPLGFGTASMIMRAGEERGQFYGPEFAGINQNGDFVYNAADGTVKTYDKLNPEIDYKIIGQSLPDLEIGWSNSITIGDNIDINFTFRGMFGHDILNATNMVFDNPSYFGVRNVLNSSTEREYLTEASQFSSYWLEKGDFVRLENLTIGYNFIPENIDWLDRFRVYVAGNNLWTITNYSGIDPGTIGVDIFNIYPKSTSVTLGVNVVF